MSVIDIARTNVVTETPDASVADVVHKIHDEEVAGLVIVEDGKPLGMVTTRDLMSAVLDDDFDAEHTPVREFVSGDVVTVHEDEGLFDVVQVMSEQSARRLPVVNDDGKLSGIISVSDVVVLLGMELNQLATAIRSRSPAYEQPGFDYYDE
jgi:CBS domain-containing protein